MEECKHATYILYFFFVIILRFSGEGEIFYKQNRVGINGESFRLLKFATMLKNSPNLGNGNMTVKNDPRILPLGNFLRKTKINELPQLFNIFSGRYEYCRPTSTHSGSF